MNTADLSTDILKAVSRSFYLTLRLLPSDFRGPLSLGYLLARLSDTIADAGALESAHRKALLNSFCKVIKTPGPGQQANDLCATLVREMEGAGLARGEMELVKRAGDCIDWLESMEDRRAAAIRKVVGIITDGQSWDLERFKGKEVVTLQDDRELETYAYQVAGSVGEFWTEIGLICDSGFSRYSAEKLRRLGANYGKGLQLVNILRDVPEDLERGRCYLPEVNPGDPTTICEALPRWQSRARVLLEDGIRYTASLRGTRLRISTGLPAALGLRTLERLEGATWEDLQQGVKISRRMVKRTLFEAFRFSAWWLPGSWDAYSSKSEPSPTR